MHSNKIKFPSNKKFGFFFTTIFLFLAIYFYFKNNSNVSYLFLLLFLIFLGISITKPNLLFLLNKLWMKLGIFLGIIVSPIILGTIFFGLFTPISILTRFFGRDELGIVFKEKNTFWTYRNNQSQQVTTYKNQF